MSSEQLHTVANRKSITLNDLPTELILEIITYTPFSPKTLAQLLQTSTRLRTIIQTHERTLVSDIKRRQFSTLSLRLFPSLETKSLPGLSTLHTRVSSLEALHAHWLEVTSHGPDLAWLKGRWEAIHRAGLLLLYRLQDVGSYCNKVSLINGLPSTSLACILFKLVSSIKILRIYGPDPMNGKYMAGDVMARSDVELAFEEMLLSHGPDFFISMLTHNRSTEWAIRTLEAEIAGMLDRQRPSPEGIPKPPTLTSCMRRAFAAKMGCHISHNVGKMWEVLSSTSFDDVDEETMIKVVNGEEIHGGMKRMF